MAVKKQSDFDPENLIATSAAHEQSLTDLSKTVSKLEKRVGDDAALAKSFKEAFESDKKMDAVLTDLVVGLISKNDDIKQAIEKSVFKIDRRWWGGTVKRVVTIGGAVFLVVLGAFLQGLFTHMFGGPQI